MPDYDKAYSLPAYLNNQVAKIREAKDKSCFADVPTYRAFFDNVCIPTSRRLLDVGCGVGRFCHAAHSRGWEVKGIDISKSAIDCGRTFAQFPMECTSLDTMAEAECGFDMVTAFEVVEHLPSPVDFLRKIRRVLRDGGGCFFTVPNWNCRLVRQATNYDAIPPYHVNFFTQLACVALLKAAGFRAIRTGIILVDPLPVNVRRLPGWLLRRVRRRHRDLGIWASAIS